MKYPATIFIVALVGNLIVLISTNSPNPTLEDTAWGLMVFVFFNIASIILGTIALYIFLRIRNTPLMRTLFLIGLSIALVVASMGIAFFVGGPLIYSYGWGLWGVLFELITS